MSVHPLIRLACAGVATVTATALLAGCGSDSDGGKGGKSGATRVITGDNGQITVPVDPKRVIATGYAVPVLIEANAPLVGISTWPRGLGLMTGPERATYDKLHKIGGATTKETNYEAIAAAKPDLIIIGVPKPVLGEMDLKRLASIAPVVAIGPSLPSAWRELSARQADAAGRAGHTEETRKAYQKRADELKAKYAGAVGGLDFGHLGAYTENSQGTFQREFGGSWGTNITQDIGVHYYGQVKKKSGGSSDVSETPSIEELPASLGEADAITYTVQDDGTPSASVQYVLDSPLWKNLPAVKAGKAFPIRYTAAATYAQAQRTLDVVDQALAPLLAK
ncbi:ABC transporter substrate-binding protein [Embleya sp. NPDC008237]|uniref:ABC transporter substrate-binding protein n=1 Tax=Embleya sp. NPDC008237 TaxID=3363978 RepID=UPI0036E83BF6